MPRNTVVTASGLTVAKGVYHLPFLKLIDPYEQHSLVPAGSYASFFSNSSTAAMS